MPQTPRIPPESPPYSDSVQARLSAIMPEGVPPLTLFRTLARDGRLFERFMSGGLLDRGHLTLRQRELVILRTTARCGSEYEWGVHATFFGGRAGLDDDELHKTLAPTPDPPWPEADAALLAVVDELCDESTLSDATWERARAHYDELALLEVIMLTGFYHTVSFITNGLRLPPERFAARFPVEQGPSSSTVV